MGLQADVSPYGSQTVTGPGWPNVDEDALGAAAAEYEALAMKLTGSVVPLQQSQLMSLSSKWTGGGAMAAAGEATTIIGGHEAHAAQAAAIAMKLRTMEVTVARTKALVNATAMETQRECEAIQAMPISNQAELIQSRLKMGLAQNMAYINANTTELAGGLGVPPTLPGTGGAGAPAQAAQQAGKAGQEAGKGSQQGMQQGMQMMMQMAQMATQIPQQLGQTVTQVPQQIMQQVAQPLQQITSMFGGGKGGVGGGMGGAPFSAFSNHPLAGGSGAGGGAGMVKAASLPGSGGIGAQTPLMAGLVGTSPEGTVVPVGAGSSAVGGVAPMSAGAAGGGMGMMPHRGESGSGGGSTASLAPPAALEYDLGEGDADDDW